MLILPPLPPIFTHLLDARLYYQRLLENFRPSYYTLQSLMGAYAFHGDVSMVKELMDVERVKHGLKVSNGMVSSLMEAHLNK